jgi:hypothetical protein
MRENVERERVERGGERYEGNSEVHRRNGFVQRLDKETTSFFFTNFPEEVKAMELWAKFARFGRVGEVYIPNKLDRQGRRFGFVQFREVRDKGELLSRLGDIWIGTFKIRVNLPRFGRDENKKESTVIAPDQRKVIEARQRDCKSFAEVLDMRKEQDREKWVAKPVQNVNTPTNDVVWEVEVETEAMERLRGAVVGFLTETKDCTTIQQNLVMDGYHNIQVIPYGHRKVLLMSKVEGEVKELIGTVGWWCTWFERFEVWSPELVSNERTIWLRCYGVPLHAWGEALFRSIAFKFGVFTEVDLSTKNLLRGDFARIKVVNNKQTTIDSSMAIKVLGKKFIIRVMEEGGVAVDGGNRCCGSCVGWRQGTSSRGSADEG